MDKMPPPKQRIELNPAEIVLDLSSSTSPSATLTLTNSSAENLLFKVRTTNPKRYLVKPNQEILLARGSVAVTVQLQARECAEILENGVQDPGKDKFMISCVVADEETLRTLKTAREAGSRELQAAYSEIWAAHGKDDTANRRIGVEFVLPSGDGSKFAKSAPTTPAAAPTPSGQSTNGAAPSSTAKSAAKVEKSASTPAPQQQAPGSMSGVVASQIQTPNKKADEVIENVTAASQSYATSEAEVSYETLSKQYKETLAALVQVTEERDRFQQKFKEVSREMVQLKEDLRASSKGRAGGDVESLTMTKSGYQIWHLVLVAMVSFLVAKLMELSRNEILSK